MLVEYVAAISHIHSMKGEITQIFTQHRVERHYLAKGGTMVPEKRIYKAYDPLRLPYIWKP